MLFLASPPFYERIGNEDFVVRERRKSWISSSFLGRGNIQISAPAPSNFVLEGSSIRFLGAFCSKVAEQQDLTKIGMLMYLKDHGAFLPISFRPSFSLFRKKLRK